MMYWPLIRMLLYLLALCINSMCLGSYGCKPTDLRYWLSTASVIMAFLIGAYS